MRILILFSVFLSFGAHAAIRVECRANNQLIILTSSAPGRILATFQNETVEADGLVGTDMVDLVAKFSSVGEVSILAKVGESSPENYMFIQGKRISVLCR